MRQREDVVVKYEGIYATIEAVVADVVKRSPLPPEETYARLQLAVAATWASTNWANEQAAPPSEADHVKFGNAYLAEPTAWTEAGAAKAGTRAQYIREVDAFFARTFAERLRGCDLLLDLGCGWGHRMVDLHLQGVNAAYMGGDRSLHSRSIIKSLASLFPALRLDWFSFDFLKPDFSAVPLGFKKVGIFTCHAIEQVEVLGTAVFDALLRRFPQTEITGVHIEPISW